jgi:hypothetical protein
MAVLLGAIKRTRLVKKLPLPKSTLNELVKLRSSIDDKKNDYDKDFYFGVRAITNNAIYDLVEYEYLDSIQKLMTLRKYLPNAIDYDKHIKLILQAKKRYDNI